MFDISGFVIDSINFVVGFCPIIQRTEGSREAARNVYGGRGVYTVDSDVLIGVSRIGEE